MEKVEVEGVGEIEDEEVVEVEGVVMEGVGGVEGEVEIGDLGEECASEDAGD